MCKKRRVTTIVCLLILTVLARFELASARQTSGFQETLVSEGLSGPTAMEFAPDGRLFVTQQSGHLRIIKNGVLLAQDFLTLSVSSDDERGLLGVAFDPGFATNGFVYVYYTRATSPIKNRVSRFTANAANPDAVQPGSEVVILDNIPSDAGNHNGGAVHFGLDGKLYVAVGDGGATHTNSQLLSSLSGKFLRINSDGSIPSDNPFVGTSGARAEIWALGLRNPYTFGVDPLTGKIHINDVGENSWEEINLAVKGANYGWPSCEGLSCGSNPNFTSPIYTYSHSVGQAITGGAFYRSSVFPSQYYGSYFFSDYVGGWIKRLDSNNQASNFWNPQNGPVDLKVGPDGALYYLSLYNGAVYQIRPTTSNQSPTASFTATPSAGAAPLAVSFNAGASSDPDGDTLTYAWDFGDSATAAGASGSHTYQSSGSYTARLTVNDGRGGTAVTTRTITVGTPPAGNIVTPAVGTLYNAGNTISYSGTATDTEDGTLPASRFSWTVVFHHDTHTHPFLGPVNGVTSGTFQIPQTGESSANTFYRIHLIVTDASGLTNETTRDIMPRKSHVTLASNVAGISLSLDGQPVSAPFSFDGVVGFTRTLSAPSPQSVGGQTYAFVSWSDQGAQTHTINTPAADATYTANYQVVVAPPQSAIAFDAASRSASGNNASTVSWSHNVSSNGTDVVLIVGAISRDSNDAARPATAVSYNGVSLTKIRQDDETVNNVYSSLWYLVNPARGSHTITITYAAAVTEAYGMAASFTGVDQASPIDASAGFTQSTGVTAGRSITTNANNSWIVDVQYTGSDGGVTPTSGQTIRTNQAIALGRTNDYGVMTTRGPVSPAGSVAMNYAYSEASQTALSIASLRPASSASSSAPPPPPPPASVIAFDAASHSSSGNNVNTLNWSHTVTSAGSNVVLIVGAVSRDSTDADRPVTSVSYNGVNLTKVRQDDEPVNNVYSSLWYLVNPPAGSHPIVITYTAPVTEAYGMAASFTGVDQVSPIDASAGFTQSEGASSAASITSHVDQAWLVDVQYAGADGGVTPTSGQTARTSQAIGVGRTNDYAVMSTKGPISPAGPSSMNYSFFESSQVAASIISLKPAGSF